jgi:pimeloyl-ACP methyl ester carboxylesterase
MVRPATGVKEQTAGLYAEKLSHEGFATLAFDARGFGESEGRPVLEDPFRIVQDARNAITFVEQLPFVNRRNIFSAGACMGGAYAAYEAVDDDRVKAVASITPYLTMHLDYPALYGGRRITLAMATVTDLVVRTFAAIGIDLFWYAVPPNRFLAALPFTLHISRGMRDYYLEGRPGQSPTWRNRLNFASQLPLIRFNPFDITRRFKKPYYLAYGTRGYSPDLMQQFFDDVQTPPEDKQLREVDGTHFEMYWQPRFVEPIVQDVSAFFGRYVD